MKKPEDNKQMLFEMMKKVNSSFIIKENPGELLGIPDLAEFLTRVDPNVNQEEMQGVMQQEYQEGGDDAVRKFFYEMTKGTDLQILGRGKYALKF